MYDELIKDLRENHDKYFARDMQAADAIKELQATLCNWCAVCPKDKRDLSTCEIYESCRAKKPSKEGET